MLKGLFLAQEELLLAQDVVFLALKELFSF
jgi:hypothetical protein